MTDRPASWRMPTPKQMEKLATADGREPRRIPNPAPGDAMPPEYWESVLRDPLADTSPMPPGASIRTLRLSEFPSMFYGWRAPAAAAPSRSRRRMPSASAGPRRSGRTSVSGCWTTPASNAPAATKKTAAGQCSNDAVRTSNPSDARPRATQSAGDNEDGDLRLSPTIKSRFPRRGRLR